MIYVDIVPEYPFFSQPISHFLLQGTELQQRLAIHVQMRRRPRVTCEESGPIFGEDKAGPGEQRGELEDQHLWREIRDENVQNINVFLQWWISDSYDVLIW